MEDLEFGNLVPGVTGSKTTYLASIPESPELSLRLRVHLSKAQAN
jgi:hypothetical protein